MGTPLTSFKLERLVRYRTGQGRSDSSEYLRYTPTSACEVRRFDADPSWNEIKLNTEDTERFSF